MKFLMMMFSGFFFVGFLPIAQSEPLNMCGVVIPEIPGFKLSMKAESGVCYGRLVSTVNLNPDILTEENIFLIEPVDFEKSLVASGRFDNNGKYIYSYADDDTFLQESETGSVDLIHSLASGSAAVRVIMSPFMLWGSDEEIAAAKSKFSLEKKGLWFDCFYGLKGIGGATVKFSACVPRSNLKGDPKLSDIKSSFEKITASKN
jgi:hypothetical protein